MICETVNFLKSRRVVDLFLAERLANRQDIIGAGRRGTIIKSVTDFVRVPILHQRSVTYTNHVIAILPSIGESIFREVKQSDQGAFLRSREGLSCPFAVV